MYCRYPKTGGTVRSVCFALASFLAVAAVVVPAYADTVEAVSVQKDDPDAGKDSPDPVDARESEAGAVVVVGEKPEKEPGVLDKLIKSRKVRFEGSYQLHYTYMPTFAMDETGANDSMKHYLDHRLNLRPTIKLRNDIDLLIDVDLLAGQLAGSTTDAASEFRLHPRSSNDWTGRSMLRELKITWRSAGGILEVGQTAYSWGMGMVYDSGRAGERDWTDKWGGDLIERVSFTTRPFSYSFGESAAARAFGLMVAGDVVFSDDMADLMDDDHAYGFTGSVFFDHNPEKSMYRMFTGVNVNYRWQDFADGWNLRQTTVDLYSDHEFRFRSGDSARLELEAALTAGSSDRPLHLAPSGFDILGWGLVFRGTYDWHRGIETSFELGAASGDSNQMDHRAVGFSFDPGFQAGMILFQDLLGRSTAWSADRAGGAAMGYEPPRGYWTSISNGSITNALYIHPQFKFYPAKGLDIRLGFLWARALVPVTSYYNVYWNGSWVDKDSPVSFRGGRPSRDLGLELDAGIYYTTPPIWKTIAIKLGLTGGWCLPGEVFDDLNGNGPGNLFKVRLGIDIVI